jgi:hypothetical protein
MLWAAILLAVAACKKEPAATGAEQPAPAAPRAPVKPALPVKAPAPIFARLADEAQRRPDSALRVEAVLAALEKAGIPTGSRRQFLAATVQARYCVGVRTKRGLPVAICEYQDEEAARRGREFSLQRFPTVEREILVNKGTTVTITTAGLTGEAREEVKRIAGVFGKL